MNAELQINQWGQIVAKAWQDDIFKKRLVAEPAVVLKEHGIQVPAGVQLRVVENTDQVIHLTLPAQPREGELSDEELEGVAGGWFAMFFAGAAKISSTAGDINSDGVPDIIVGSSGAPGGHVKAF